MPWNGSLRAQREADDAYDQYLARRAKRTGVADYRNKDGSINYRVYLRSSKWRARKLDYYSRHEKKCAACSSTTDIHLHHLHYNTLGRELDCDLEPLCVVCHDSYHGIYRK